MEDGEALGEAGPARRFLSVATGPHKGADDAGRGTCLLFGERVLLEDGLVPASVRVEDGRIAAVWRGRAVEGADRLPARSILAPGFIDVQVNGGGGVLFNDDPTADGIARIVAAHRDGGTTGLLPTLITDAPGRIERAADAVAAFRASRGAASGVLGLHVEGPFISRRRPGVHPPQHIRRLGAGERDRLAALPARGTLGAVLLTLAPEEVATGDIEALARAGIVLSAGHTEADPAACAAARAAGLRGYTHLWNAMPPLAGRAPGPVGAALLDRDAFCGIIADLIHVDPANLALTLRLKGADRVFLVSDAMPPTGTDATRFTLLGRSIRRADGRLATEDGTLAGADITMIDAVRRVHGLRGTGLGLDAVLRMASEVPAEFLGLADRGRIAPGLAADLVLLSDALAVVATAVAGRWSAAV